MPSKRGKGRKRQGSKGGVVGRKRLSRKNRNAHKVGNRPTHHRSTSSLKEQLLRRDESATPPHSGIRTPMGVVTRPSLEVGEGSSESPAPGTPTVIATKLFGTPQKSVLKKSGNGSNKASPQLSSRVRFDLPDLPPTPVPSSKDLAAALAAASPIVPPPLPSTSDDEDTGELRVTLQESITTILDTVYPDVEDVPANSDADYFDPFDTCDEEDEGGHEKAAVEQILQSKLPSALFRRRRRHSVDGGALGTVGFGAGQTRKQRALSVSSEGDGDNSLALKRKVLHSEVVKVLFTTILARSTAKLRYDDPRLPSLRAKFLERVFQRMPESRLTLCRHMAETTMDYMQMFLEERKQERLAPVHIRAGAGTPAPRSAKSVGPGDGTILAETMTTYISTVCEACGEVTPDTVPEHTQALTKMTEMLAMAVVHLCRARPTLDSNFGDLMSCLNQLLSVRPQLAITVLRRLIHSWPRNDSEREVSWLALTRTVLLSTPAPTVCSERLHVPLMKKLATAIKSLHADVARSAVEIISNMYIMLHYILPYSELFAKVRAALVENRKHWNTVVVEMSDQQFENMLDLA